MIRGEGLSRLYQNGGTDMLAYRLGALFSKVETEADKTRHNDMLAEVLDLINKDFPNKAGQLLAPENKMLNFIAEYLLYQKVNRKKRFLFRVAEQILMYSKLKG